MGFSMMYRGGTPVWAAQGGTDEKLQYVLLKEVQMRSPVWASKRCTEEEPQYGLLNEVQMSSPSMDFSKKLL